jgi:hypothetical protein
MRTFILLISCLITSQFVFAQDIVKTTYSYYVEIDCDHDSESNEWTNSNLTIILHLKNGRTYPIYLNGISESESQAQSVGSAFTKDKAVTKRFLTSSVELNKYEMDKISITTQGTDAFMIDALALTWERKTTSKSKDIGTTLLNVVRDPIETRTGTIQTWGVNGGGAWCLSTDPEDGNGGWSDTVNGCFTTVEFDIQTGKSRKIK